MRFGAILPQTEIGADPIAVRDFAQAAESLGYAHLATFEHVLGADTANRPNWSGAYNLRHLFHEPFVMFGYLAALTQRLELVTSVLVLPQRQTVLVAKQATEVDVLTGGRLRLGIGIGWNQVEYEALGEDFGTRGKRSEEQIALLRALFTQESVTFHGRWHQVEAAGLNPLPIQRPIPIWLGGNVDAVLRRVGAMGDGWMPQLPAGEAARSAVEKLREYALAAGRDPAHIGIEPRVSIASGTPDDWARAVEWWRGQGATHFSVLTMRAGLPSPQAHLEAIRRFRDAVDFR